MGKDLEMTFENEGKEIQYTWPNDPPASYRFILVDDPRTDSINPFYLGTTEVSFAFFTRAIDRMKKRKQIRDFLPKEAELGENRDSDIDRNYRDGIWIWEYVDKDGAKLELRENWVATEGSLGTYYYTKTIRRPSPPEYSHPMQQISPHLAIYFAAFLGCRLPSSAEWALASKLYSQTGRQNLRDQTWNKQKEYVPKLDQKVTFLVQPDSGIFLPDNGKESNSDSIPRNENTYSDDGSLWFDSVRSGDHSPIKHLIGNVAEYVFDAPEAFDHEFGNGSQLDGAKVVRFAKSEKYRHQFFVIGGSALSPPELKISIPYPVGTLKNHRRGYSDVGFRLAFSPPKPLAVRLKTLVANQQYLSN